MSAFKHSAVSFGTSDTPPPEAGRNIGPISLHNAIRACLVRVRVRIVLYALFYEKDVSNRPLRCRMDPLAIVPTYPKSRGKTTHPLLARCSRRHLLLRLEKWLSLAAFAP